MDPMITEPNARVLAHRVPPAAPGKCAVCGYSGGTDGDDRTFVDFGFDLDYYGVVYFCSSCMTEIGNAIGWVDGDQYGKVLTDNLFLEDELKVARSERDAANHALRTYLNGGSGVGARAESAKLPETNQPSKRASSKKPAPKSAVDSNVAEQGRDDSSDDDGDIISLV